MLRVTIRPGRTWPFLLLEIGGLIIFAVLAYQSWTRVSQEFRGVFILAVLAGAAELMFQLSGIEIMEVNASKIMLTKDVHGWERKREYEIKECRELEWIEGTEDKSQRLQLKTGWRTITFGNNLTENQAIQILTALQQTRRMLLSDCVPIPKGKGISLPWDRISPGLTTVCDKSR